MLLLVFVPLCCAAVPVHVTPVEVMVLSDGITPHADLENAFDDDGNAAQIGWRGSVVYRLQAETPLPSDAVLEPATLSVWIWGQGDGPEQVIVSTSNAPDGAMCSGWGIYSVPETETRLERELGCCLSLPVCGSMLIGVEELNNGEVYIKLYNSWTERTPVLLQYLEINMAYHLPSPELTCPPDVEVPCGADTSPDSTGWATAEAGGPSCPDVELTYADEYYTGECGDWFRRTWTATDNCDHTVSCQQWIGMAPGLAEVEIDILPGIDPNTVDLQAGDLIPVAILSSDDFNARWIDPATVVLEGLEVAIRGKANGRLTREEDVNGDGRLDLIVSIEARNGNPGALQQGTACVSGENGEGRPFHGCDAIRILPICDRFVGLNGTILDRGWPDDVEPPVVGELVVDARYQTGEAITGCCLLVDPSGDPLEGDIVALTVYAVEIGAEFDLRTALDTRILHQDPATGAYCFELPTDELAPGYYDVRLGVPFVTHQWIRVEVQSGEG
jgi:hypothetical protein